MVSKFMARGIGLDQAIGMSRLMPREYLTTARRWHAARGKRGRRRIFRVRDGEFEFETATAENAPAPDAG